MLLENMRDATFEVSNLDIPTLCAVSNLNPVQKVTRYTDSQSTSIECLPELTVCDVIPLCNHDMLLPFHHAFIVLQSICRVRECAMTSIKFVDI